MNNVQSRKRPSTLPHSREAQRARLVGCAEATIAARGLASLRARDLAACAGCSVGSLYNLVTDLDELVLLVGQRTMAQLDAALSLAAQRADQAAERAGRDESLAGAADGIGELRLRLLAWARAYAAFAIAHRERWRALFEFRMTRPRDFPDWFAADQVRIFEPLEQGLAPFLTNAEPRLLQARARALFAAVHGIVALGLDEKLIGLPADAIDAELAAFVTIYVDGLVGRAAPQGLSGSHTSVSSL